MSKNAYAKALSDRKYAIKIVMAKKGKGSYRRKDKYTIKGECNA